MIISEYSDGSPQRKAIRKFNRHLTAALHRLLVPLAAHARFAAGVLEMEPDSGNVEWLLRHDSCPCTDGAIDRTDSPGEMLIHETCYRDLPAARILLCARGADHSLTSILRSLIDEAGRAAEQKMEDEDLLHELGANWESLNTLYEISSDLRTSQSIPDILGRILHKIVAGSPSLHAVIWIERDGVLEPAVAHGVDSLQPRTLDRGLLGRAAVSRMPVVLNERSRTPVDPDIEPELAQAARMALIPIATRDRLSGLIEIWQTQGSDAFDAPTIRFFEALALQAAMVIESERTYRISLAEAKLRKEFEIGGSIQKSLLSGRPPAAVPGIEIGMVSVPSHTVDGDFFDFLPWGESGLDLFVGDVMGKGIPAALVGAEAKSDLLRSFGQLTAASRSRQLPAPKDIVTYVHRHLTGRLIAIESFISLFYGRFDLGNRNFVYVDCGHPRAMHYRAATRKLDLLSGDNMPLGMMEGGEYTQESAAFDSKDLFLFYSDGVTDAHNDQGVLFGEQRLQDCLRANASLDPMELCNRIRESVAAFTDSRAVSDDFTCLAVKLGQLPEPAPAMRWSTEFYSRLEFLPALRTWVRGVCQCMQANNARTADALELAVTETVSNIIRHAYQGRPDHKIILDAVVDNRKATFTFTHWGTRFRPKSASIAVPEAARGHGYGLFILSQILDSISYRDGPAGADCIILEKHHTHKHTGECAMMATTEKLGDVTLVRVALDTLDAGNEKRFKKEVISTLKPDSKVILDLSEVDFIDSSGLGVILSCFRHLHAGGGELKLCGLNAQVRTLFELVRMHRIFDIYPTREEALACFSGH